MAAVRIFNFRSRGAVRSAYDETTPPVVRAPRRAPLSVLWSSRSDGRLACRWQA
jgi:hypothetical protein